MPLADKLFQLQMREGWPQAPFGCVKPDWLRLGEQRVAAGVLPGIVLLMHQKHESGFGRIRDRRDDLINTLVRNAEIEDTKIGTARTDNRQSAADAKALEWCERNPPAARSRADQKAARERCPKGRAPAQRQKLLRSFDKTRAQAVIVVEPEHRETPGAAFIYTANNPVERWRDRIGGRHLDRKDARVRRDEIQEPIAPALREQVGVKDHRPPVLDSLRGQRRQRKCLEGSEPGLQMRWVEQDARALLDRQFSGFPKVRRPGCKDREPDSADNRDLVGICAHGTDFGWAHSCVGLRNPSKPAVSHVAAHAVAQAHIVSHSCRQAAIRDRLNVYGSRDQGAGMGA